MKAFSFIKEIFRKFPYLLTLNIIMLISTSIFSACSLLTISPLVDFLINPDLQNISPLTQKAVDILRFFGLPVNLKIWLLVFLLFITFTSAFQVFTRHSILRTKYAVLRDIIHGTFEDFFNANWYFFSSGRQGVLLNTLMREIAVVGNAFGAMALFFTSILQVMFYLVIPFYISWQVTLISLSVALFFALPFILLGRLNYKLGRMNTSTSNKMSSVIHENLALAKLVLGFGSQHKSIQNLDEAFDAHRKVTIKSQILDIATPLLYRPFGAIMIIIALFAARRFVVPLSEITVLLLALLQVAIAISSLTQQKNSLDNFFPSYEQVEGLRKQARELKQVSGGKEFKGFDRDLIINNISFAYPGHDPVLRDINIRIPKGKMIALVGPSGAGKSTLIDIIMGFYQPQKGNVLVDGFALDLFNIGSYRSKIGYVPQESALFNTTIRENLIWARESATDRDIEAACRQANADEFINLLPKGYDTVVGDRGVRLSGGQVQRIALARAILRKPEMLILDEATSALDTYSERLIQRSIEEIAKATTVVVIAHRLSTILNANYIYVLRGGRMLEEGTYSDLVQSNGHFNCMVKSQLLEIKE